MTKNLEKLQKLPSVEKIKNRFKKISIKTEVLTEIIRVEINEFRKILLQEKKEVIDNPENIIIANITKKIKKLQIGNIQKVINGTGIILHTGLGRAPFSENLYSHLKKILTGYQNLELELESGKRGERLEHIKEYLGLLSLAEDSIVVNNNAAALILILNTLANSKEIIVSRGELIEIGGSFRLPDIISKSGAVIKEVGTTNRTHLSDYEKAINANTAAILLAHTSNYKIKGFTKSPQQRDIIALAQKHDIPIVFDLGSGDFDKFCKSNNVSDIMKKGFDIVCFSGDKLLGGPQSGIILGKRKLIKKIHKNPFYRAFRCDKFTLITLEWTLRQILFNTSCNIGKMQLSARTLEELQDFALQIIKPLDSRLIEKTGIKIINTQVETGSGSLPLELNDSIAIVFQNIKAEKIAKAFRLLKTPIIGYIKNNIYHIDLRAVDKQDGKLLSNLLCDRLKKLDQL